MLDLLQETLFYIEEQNAWLSYLQSAIVEKEHKYKVLHSKIKDEIKKEWAQRHQIVMVDRGEEDQSDVEVKEEQDDMNAEPNYWQQEDNANLLLGNLTNNIQQGKITASTITQSQNVTDIGEMSLYHREDFVKIPEISESFNAVKHSKNSSMDSAMRAFSTNAVGEGSNLELTYHSQIPASSHTKDSKIVTKAIENTSSAAPIGLEIIVADKSEVLKKDGFSCPQCNKVWPTKQSLKQHFQTHTGEKPFNCSFCNKAFGRQGTLNRHMLIHTGEKPFKCFVCNKPFRHKFNLTVHQNKHTGEKPYKCTHCGKSFGQRSTLSYHWKTHRKSSDNTIEWPSLANEAENNMQVSTLSLHSEYQVIPKTTS